MTQSPIQPEFFQPIIYGANCKLQKGFLRNLRIGQQGEISCQFLLPGGSIGPRYVLQLLFCLKSQNCQKLNNH
jgi:hypothetical protein